MLTNESNTAIVILAAGHGTRMKSELPKVMHELGGKPLIDHMVTHAKEAGVAQQIVLVVAPDSDMIRNHIGNTVSYAVQEQQLGTGDAARAAEGLLRGNAQHVMVLYADLPFLRGESIRALAEGHTRSGNVISMLTTRVPNFEEPWKHMYDFGRIIRDGHGHVVSITEMKDCTEEQRTITELNTGLYCFDGEWLWSHLGVLQNNNVQHEYYLTDLIAMAIADGKSIETVDLDPRESFGINSQEDLAQAKIL